MPWYEFQCAICGTVFEASEDRHAQAHPPCPSCGGATRRRLGGGGGILIRPATNFPSSASPSASCRRERAGVGCCGSTARCDHPGPGDGSCHRSRE
jgi:putative FmdB family regulatory protein